MSFSGLIAILALAAAGVFAILNQPLLLESHDVAVPGGAYAIPLVSILLGGAAAVIVLMLLGEAAAAASWRWSRAALSRRIGERDRELLTLKTGTSTGLEQHLEDTRHDLAQRIDTLARLIEARFPAQTTIRDAMREEPEHAILNRETVSTRRG